MNFSSDFPYAFGTPAASALFRQTAADFQVDEMLGFSPDGSGEHVYLHIQKRGENTGWIAREIAALAGVKEMDVGFGGRKDRHAITTQWFSVYLPPGKPEPDWNLLANDQVSLLAATRHARKLRRGEHQANRFQIRLRHVTTANPVQLEQRVEAVLRQGVPNYFGEQRFGNSGGNLEAVERVLIERKPARSRSEKGMIISAARSWLFNQVLAERIRRADWREAIAGEPGSSATGPLWGRGRPLVQGELALVEQQVLAPWSSWCDALEHQGLSQERRPLLLQPVDSSWQWQDGDLLLSFTLAAGEFATSVLREVARLESGRGDGPTSESGTFLAAQPT